MKKTTIAIMLLLLCTAMFAVEYSSIYEDFQANRSLSQSDVQVRYVHSYYDSTLAQVLFEIGDPYAMPKKFEIDVFQDELVVDTLATTIPNEVKINWGDGTDTGW